MENNMNFDFKDNDILYPKSNNTTALKHTYQFIKLESLPDTDFLLNTTSVAHTSSNQTTVTHCWDYAVTVAQNFVENYPNCTVRILNIQILPVAGRYEVFCLYSVVRNS